MPSGTWVGGVGAALFLAGCATAPKAPPPAAPVVPPPAAVETMPPPPPPPAPPPAWEDMAVTPGDWRFAAAPVPHADYSEGEAAVFSLRCEAPQRRVVLVRPGAGAGSRLTVRTTFGARDVAVGEGGTAALAASDPFLDGIAFSRGRIAVETAGLPALTLPTWPEPARVIEECRG